MSASNYTWKWVFDPSVDPIFEYRKCIPDRKPRECPSFRCDYYDYPSWIDHKFARRRHLPGGYHQRYTFLKKFGRLIKAKSNIEAFTNLLAEKIYPLPEFALCHFKTPLHIAIDHGRWDVIKILIEAGHPVDYCAGAYHVDRTNDVPPPLLYTSMHQRLLALACINEMVTYTVNLLKLTDIKIYKS